MKTYYKGYLIEPAETIYSPKFQIVNINDCDDFVRYADTFDEAKLIIDEIIAKITMKKGIYFFNLLNEEDKKDFVKEYEWYNEEKTNGYFEQEFENMYDFLIKAFEWGCNEGQWLSIIKINE